MKVQEGTTTTAVQARSEVIGSLLRPPYLAEARSRHEEQAVTDTEFKRFEDRAAASAFALSTLLGDDSTVTLVTLLFSSSATSTVTSPVIPCCWAIAFSV